MADEPNPYPPTSASADHAEPAGGVERLLNWFADMDWTWWPFLYLRPPKHEPISTARVVKMTLHYGPILALLLVLLGVLQGSSPALLARVVVGSVLAFFVLSRLTFAVTWNRRARRLGGGG